MEGQDRIKEICRIFVCSAATLCDVWSVYLYSTIYVSPCHYRHLVILFELTVWDEFYCVYVCVCAELLSIQSPNDNANACVCRLLVHKMIWKQCKNLLNKSWKIRTQVKIRCTDKWRHCNPIAATDSPAVINKASDTKRMIVTNWNLFRVLEAKWAAASSE